MIALEISLSVIIMAVFSSRHQEKDVFIRIENNTAFVLEKVELSSSSTTVYFGDVGANQKSDYKTFANAYATMAITAEIEGKIIKFLPDDYLGEQHLKPARYTFKINVIKAEGQMHLVPRSAMDKPQTN